MNRPPVEPLLECEGDGVHYQLYRIASGSLVGAYVASRRLGVHPPRYSAVIASLAQTPVSPEEFSALEYRYADIRKEQV